MIIHYDKNFLDNALPPSDLILIEAGSLITASGFLKLSTSSGREVAKRYAGVEKEMGGYLSGILEPSEKIRSGAVIYEDYNLIVSPTWPDRKMGLIQTARHDAHFNPEVARESIRQLADWMYQHPTCRVDLPLLGYSYPYTDVRGLITYMNETLGINAHVWYPAAMIPKSIPLPEDHLYTSIVETSESFDAGGQMRYRDKWDVYLGDMYDGGISDTQVGRLTQWMAIEQYATSGDRDSAFVISRLRMSEMVNMYGIVEEGDDGLQE